MLVSILPELRQNCRRFRMTFDNIRRLFSHKLCQLCLSQSGDILASISPELRKNYRRLRMMSDHFRRLPNHTFRKSRNLEHEVTNSIPVPWVILGRNLARPRR